MVCGIKSKGKEGSIHIVCAYLLLDGGVFLFHVSFLFGSIHHQLVQLQETERLISQANQTTWSHTFHSDIPKHLSSCLTQSIYNWVHFFFWFVSPYNYRKQMTELQRSQNLQLVHVNQKSLFWLNLMYELYGQCHLFLFPIFTAQTNKLLLHRPYTGKTHSL